MSTALPATGFWFTIMDDGCNTVYRALADGEAIADGLSARNPNASVSELSHVAGKKDSQWISTTKDLSVAIEKYDSGNGGVAIDLSLVDSPISDISAGIPDG